MKLAFVLSLLLAASSLLSSAIAETKAGEGEKKTPIMKDVYVLVETTDYADNVHHSIMTGSEFKDLVNEINLEDRLYEKAIAIADKEWKRTPKYGKQPFPRTSVDKKTIREIKRSNNSDEMTSKLDALIKRASEKAKDKKQQPRSKTNQKNQKDQPNASQDRQEKKKEKAAEREQTTSDARKIFTEAMEGLKTNKLSTKAEGQEDKTK